jgi:hypothetical protein
MLDMTHDGWFRSKGLGEKKRKGLASFTPGLCLVRFGSKALEYRVVKDWSFKRASLFRVIAKTGRWYLVGLDVFALT